MPISMYQASVPVFRHGLGTLSHILRKGEAHARETGSDPASLVGARLAPDMLTLAGQVQRASDTSKLALERITGVTAPKMEDNEASFADLLARIERTVMFIDSFAEAQFEGTDATPIELKLRSFTPVFTGASYLLTFALPNFFFHVTTAYDILRHKGVPLGKLDYLRLQES
ncbi:MAG: DUF1993 family protein [Pseudorhodoplanes sp.]|uniref:DUF1993 domain-containing protein n=1 Tax=Pseudorhodoplanes sp. TaxID=1934341 RepID=UPI003D10319F